MADGTGMVRRALKVLSRTTPMQEAAAGAVELVVDGEHLRRVVQEGVLRARTTVDIMTADLKAMLVPTEGGDGGTLVSRGGRGRSAPSIIAHLIALAERGVEVRVLHAGVPSGPALEAIRRMGGGGSGRLVLRRCPRLHAKAVIVDARAMYLGSANLTGAGLGAKGEHRRNFEMGVWTTSPPLIDAVMQQFNALWEGERCVKCQRKDVCPEPLEEPRLREKSEPRVQESVRQRR